MAHYKLSDDDEHFLGMPPGAALISSGSSGTETWIERDLDTVVRIAVHAVAIATSDGATLEVRIQIGEDSAKGQDGPAAAEATLRASQSIQTVVKAGQRLVFQAHPVASHAQVLRTVVWAADLDCVRPTEASRSSEPDHRSSAPNGEDSRPPN